MTSEIPLEDWTIRDFNIKNVSGEEKLSTRQHHMRTEDSSSDLSYHGSNRLQDNQRRLFLLNPCVHPLGKNSRDPFGVSIPLHRLARSRRAGNHRAPHRFQTPGQRTHGPVLQTLPHCGALQVWPSAHNFSASKSDLFCQTRPTWRWEGFSLVSFPHMFTQRWCRTHRHLHSHRPPDIPDREGEYRGRLWHRPWSANAPTPDGADRGRKKRKIKSVQLLYNKVYVFWSSLNFLCLVRLQDQYVFLNQCAMDIIRSRTGTNVDLIYQNTAALCIYENVEPKRG